MIHFRLHYLTLSLLAMAVLAFSTHAQEASSAPQSQSAAKQEVKKASTSESKAKKEPNATKTARSAPAKGQRANPDAEKAVKSALPPELTEHFPIGRKFLGVSVPSYTGNQIKSVLTADSITRIDQKFLDLENLNVRIYNSSGDPETIISMDEAEYDLLTGELASKTPSTIEQPRFIMTGDKMTFNTETEITRMIGNVRLIVPDAGKVTSNLGFPGEKPAEKDTP